MSPNGRRALWSHFYCRKMRRPAERRGRASARKLSRDLSTKTGDNLENRSVKLSRFGAAETGGAPVASQRPRRMKSNHGGSSENRSACFVKKVPPTYVTFYSQYSLDFARFTRPEIPTLLITTRRKQPCWMRQVGQSGRGGKRPGRQPPRRSLRRRPFICRSPEAPAAFARLQDQTFREVRGVYLLMALQPNDTAAQGRINPWAVRFDRGRKRSGAGAERARKLDTRPPAVQYRRQASRRKPLRVRRGSADAALEQLDRLASNP